MSSFSGKLNCPSGPAPRVSTSKLKQELITEILSRLPVKTLVRFLCVSKTWYALIKNPDFINMHLKSSIKSNRDRRLVFQTTVHFKSEDCELPSGENRTTRFYSACFPENDSFGRAVKLYQPLRRPKANTRILGCCNGLVCIYNRQEVIAIWNPFIRKYKKLPLEPSEVPPGLYPEDFPRWNPADWTGSYSLSCCELAFGYDRVYDDYKVVRVTALTLKYFEVKIYSLRAHSWKKLKRKWPVSSIATKPAYLNGALHWFSRCRSMYKLLTYNLSNEKFRLDITPFRHGAGDAFDLEVLSGCLCFWEHVFLRACDFWVMTEYGVASSWSRLYRIIMPDDMPWGFCYCKPLVISKDGGKLLLQLDDVYLYWYDEIKKTSSKVEILDMPDRFQTATCVESLVLLDGDNVIESVIEAEAEKEELEELELSERLFDASSKQMSHLARIWSCPNNIQDLVYLLLDEYNSGAFAKGNLYYERMGNRIAKKLNIPDVSGPQVLDQVFSLKEDYEAFRILKEQIGVRWDEENNTVDADLEWWESMELFHPNISKFQKKGLANYAELHLIFANSIASGALAYSSSQKAPTREELARRENTLRGMHSARQNVYAVHMASGGGVNINRGGVASMDTGSDSRKRSSPSVTGARQSCTAQLASEEFYIEELRDNIANKRFRNGAGSSASDDKIKECIGVLENLTPKLQPE